MTIRMRASRYHIWIRLRGQQTCSPCEEIQLSKLVALGQQAVLKPQDSAPCTAPCRRASGMA